MGSVAPAQIQAPTAASTPASAIELCEVAVTLRARERMIVPEAARGHVLRGAFSLTFRRLVCVDPTLALDCRACALDPVCPWPAVFLPAPPPGAERLRLTSDLPRPFVVKPELGGAPERRPGEAYGFRLVLVGAAARHLPYFIVALRRLGDEGMGPRRGRFEVVRVESGSGIVFEEGAPAVRVAPPETIDLAPAPAGDARVTIEFLTPTEIKHEGRVLRRPSFSALVRRIRDRANALSTFFGAGPLPLDFAGLGRRAESVHLVEDRTTWRETSRRSSRTGEWHELSGLLGRAVFEGPASEFVPLLRAAERVHVGRHAAFGNGWIGVEAG